MTPTSRYSRFGCLLPFGDGFRPPPEATRVLGPNEHFADVKELSYYGPIIDQDADMMPRVQQGLRANRTGKITLSAYQEMRNPPHAPYIIGVYGG